MYIYSILAKPVAGTCRFTHYMSAMYILMCVHEPCPKGPYNNVVYKQVPTHSIVSTNN